MISGDVEISGFAWHSNFWYYKLEYRQEGKEYVLIPEPDHPEGKLHYETVSNGTLATWRTGQMPGGWYYLRLRVVDKTGNWPVPECEIRVLVEKPTPTPTPIPVK